jgi:transposase
MIFPPETLTRDEMEARRLLAAVDFRAGRRQAWVAKKYGVTRTTASRWARSLRAGGKDALRKTKAPGRPFRISPGESAIIAAMFRSGPPKEKGLRRDRWTSAAFAEAIFARIGVRYHSDHVSRMMKRFRDSDDEPRFDDPAQPGHIEARA